MTETFDVALLPTEADVASYQTHGYWISPPVLSDDLLDTVEHGAERLYAGEFDQPLPDGDRRRGWTPDDGDVLRKNDFSSLLIDEIAQLVRHSFVAAAAARLSNADEIRLWHDQLLYKPSEQTVQSGTTANVGWHTDRQYWRTCSSDQMLTAWVPFHDIDEATGPLTFVDGSHRWDEDVVLDFWNQDLGALDRLREKHDITLVSAEIPRGAMSFHHCRMIHGSGPNRSGKPRRSIAIHLQPGGNHFVRYVRDDGTVAGHSNDKLVRATPEGLPDYADPAVCPRLWPPAT